MLRIAAKLLKVLNSETEPGQISLALCFSMIAGLTPIAGPHNILVFLLAFLLRVNLSAFILGLGIFSGMAYGLDTLFHRIGLAVLTAGPLEGFWTSLYNIAVWRIERFNNTVVMGSLAFSLVLFVPLLLLSNAAIRRYREHVIDWIQRTRVMKFVRTSSFYQIYQSVSGWGGGI